MSSIAQDEVRKLSERTRFGFKRAQENSVLLGQDNLFGYRKIEQHLEVVASEAAVVREVFERYAAGRSGLRAIANDLDSRGIRSRQGKPLTYSTLYGMIRNPKYKGFYAGRRYATRDYRDKRSYRLEPQQWITHRDSRIPAIVSEPLWEEANRLLAARGKAMKQHAQAAQNRYAYSGKLICAVHGTTFHRHRYLSKKRGEVECWNCRLYRLKGKQNGCYSPTIYSDELDRILAKVFEQAAGEKSGAIQEYIDNLKSFASRQDHTAELARLIQQSNTIRKKKEKLLELTLTGALSNEEFRQRNEQYNQQLTKQEQQRSQLTSAGQSLTERIRRAEQLAETIRQQWNTHCGFSREISRALVDHIIVNSDETNTQIHLDIVLTLGDEYYASYQKSRSKNHFPLFDEIHISQAQVSRLEKTALERIRNQI